MFRTIHSNYLLAIQPLKAKPQKVIKKAAHSFECTAPLQINFYLLFIYNLSLYFDLVKQKVIHQRFYVRKFTKKHSYKF